MPKYLLQGVNASYVILLDRGVARKLPENAKWNIRFGSSKDKPDINRSVPKRSEGLHAEKNFYRLVGLLSLGLPPHGAYMFLRQRDWQNWQDMRSSNLYWDLPCPRHNLILPHPYCGA